MARARRSPKSSRTPCRAAARVTTSTTTRSTIAFAIIWWISSSTARRRCKEVRRTAPHSRPRSGRGWQRRGTPRRGPQRTSSTSSTKRRSKMKRESEAALAGMMKPMKREDVTDLIVFRKMKMGIKWPQIAKAVGQSKEWTAAACLGQMQMTKKQAEAVGKLFDLPEEAVLLLQQVPYKGSLPTAVPTDPLIYRFYELVNVYGTCCRRS